mmetsp:Transcript_25082/g.59201  ORF Transcript_25082/g.59201 Transcript_25082/m.59201 type:complete len:238 (+) Transcript_25082:884-1597(+)
MAVDFAPSFTSVSTFSLWSSALTAVSLSTASVEVFLSVAASSCPLFFRSSLLLSLTWSVSSHDGLSTVGELSSWHCFSPSASEEEDSSFVSLDSSLVPDSGSFLVCTVASASSFFPFFSAASVSFFSSSLAAVLDDQNQAPDKKFVTVAKKPPFGFILVVAVASTDPSFSFLLLVEGAAVGDETSVSSGSSSSSSSSGRGRAIFLLSSVVVTGAGDIFCGIWSVRIKSENVGLKTWV